MIKKFLAGLEMDLGKFFFFTLSLVMISLSSASVSFACGAGIGIYQVAHGLIALTFVLMMVSSCLLPPAVSSCLKLPQAVSHMHSAAPWSKGLYLLLTVCLTAIWWAVGERGLHLGGNTMVAVP